MGINKEKFQEEINLKRQEDIEPLVTMALTEMLKDDICLGNSVYVYERVLQIISQTIQKLDFTNETIMKARRAFLDVLIDGMRENMFTLDDELIEAKKGIKSKDKDEKRKNIERLKALERVRDKLPQNSTEERDIECEPVAQHIAGVILSKEWILRDDNYITKAIRLDDELLLNFCALGYANALFEQVGYSLEQTYITGSEKHWGCAKRKLRLGKLHSKMLE